MSDFLPVTRQDMLKRGQEQLDVVCITGDAYVDHPSFGIAIISRLIEAEGFSVGIIAQPDWHKIEDFCKLGKPRLGFFITAGNIDSMVAHYTAAKRKRSDDAYTAGGKAGSRPDRAVTVYSRMTKRAYPDVPVIIGGLEASLRRFAHYDYWEDTVRPSVLCDSGADLLVYGMGENQTIQILHRLAAGEAVSSVTDIRGTCYLTDPVNTPWGAAECPSFAQVRENKKAYARACRIQMNEQDDLIGRRIIQRQEDKMLVQNPPMPPLTTKELDRIYALPYMRAWHPMYDALGGVPGFEEVEFSITHNRGCFGNCNFCSIALHQGRKITCRSEKSILAEAVKLTKMPNFKGYIHDVGGPTANFRHPSCHKQLEKGMCRGKKCLAPTPCPALEVDHMEYLGILRKLRELDGVKKVFIRSGIRYDYLLLDKDDTFLRELVKYHVSGQLKVAPEHCSAAVLDRMGKPHIESYKEFSRRYFAATGQAHKEQYLVPYLMSSHPGSTLHEAIELALFLKREHIRPQQVQDFYPTPGTVSTCMFYTGLDPYTMEPVYVPKSAEEKRMQRALLQYYKPENREIIEKALRLARRTDLIGNGQDCLVKSRSTQTGRPPEDQKSKNKQPVNDGGSKYGGKKKIKK